jgi:hypothetical protein
MPDGSSADTTRASSLISDDGIVFYTLNDPELLLGDQMRSITQDANAYYLDHSHYPPEGTVSGYRNIYTRAASKPKLKRSEFLATDADDVLRQVDNWKAEVANPKEAVKTGVIDCFELLVSYPKGKVELFAVRSCKPNQKAQLVVSTNGELSASKTAPFVPEDGGIRPRRVWIEIQNINELDAFCLHHASLVFWIFISLVVSTSYAFLNLRGPARRIRYRILFVSLALVAIYAAGTVLSF